MIFNLKYVLLANMYVNNTQTAWIRNAPSYIRSPLSRSAGPQQVPTRPRDCCASLLPVPRAMTPNEVKALDFIRERVVEAGFAPTLDEIGAHIGISGPGAFRVVRSLAAAGHVVRAPGKARGIDLPGYSNLRNVDTEVLRAELVRRGEIPANFAPRSISRNTVPCAANRCRTAVRRAHIFCPAHWSMVPPGVRDALVQRHSLALEPRSPDGRSDYQIILDLIRDRIDSGAWR